MKNSSHWNTQMIYQDSLFTQPLTSLTTFIVVFSSVGRSEIISEKGRKLHFHVHLASLCRLVFYQVPGSVFFFWNTHQKFFNSLYNKCFDRSVGSVSFQPYKIIMPKRPTERPVNNKQDTGKWTFPKMNVIDNVKIIV